MASPEQETATVAGPPPAAGSRYRMVDLTLLLAEELPCWWSTHMPYLVEALRDLHQVPARGANVLFAPLRVARGTGAPGRALAWVPVEDAAGRTGSTGGRAR